MSRSQPPHVPVQVSNGVASTRGRSGESLWVPITLLIITLIAFAPAFDAEFTLRDDAENVAKNPQMLASPRQIISFWTETRHPNAELYVPLTQTVWYAIGRLAALPNPTADGFYFSPIPFHLINILLHALNGWLVYLILRRLSLSFWAAAAGALLFLLHPLQVEAVAWVSGLRDVLSATLILGSLYAWITFVDTGLAASAQRLQWGRYVLASGAFVLAMFAKPASVITPLLAVIVGAWVALLLVPSPIGYDAAKKIFPWLFVFRRIVVPLIPWVFLALPFIVVAERAQPTTQVPDTPIWQRPLVSTDALAFYIAKLAVPLSLGIDYSRTPTQIARSGAMYWTWAVPAALVIAAIYFRRRWPLALPGVALFIAAPLPVLGLIKFGFQFYSTVSDRYMYVAMLGVAMTAGALLARVGNNSRVLGICAVVLLALGILTFIQAGYWKDDFTLFDHAQDVNPRSLQAANHLGRIYWEQGQLPQAIEQYQRAVNLRPELAPSHRALGNVLLASERFADATKEFEAALPGDPSDAGLLNNLGLSLWKSARPVEARIYLERAIERDPRYLQPELALAMLLAEQGDRPAAAAHFRRALQIDPNSAIARQGLDALTPR